MRPCACLHLVLTEWTLFKGQYLTSDFKSVFRQKGAQTIMLKKFNVSYIHTLSARVWFHISWPTSDIANTSSCSRILYLTPFLNEHGWVKQGEENAEQRKKRIEVENLSVVPAELGLNLWLDKFSHEVLSYPFPIEFFSIIECKFNLVWNAVNGYRKIMIETFISACHSVLIKHTKNG